MLQLKVSLCLLYVYVWRRQFLSFSGDLEGSFHKGYSVAHFESFHLFFWRELDEERETLPDFTHFPCCSIAFVFVVRDRYW